MLEKIKTYLLYGKHFCGIEQTIQDGEEKVFGTVLKKTKKELDIENAFEVSSNEMLASKLPKKQHVFLIVNNHHVLTKQLESSQPNLEKLVYNAFPNINLDDFYYEIVTQGNKYFVSICRKDYLDECIAKYKESGIAIINITLGNIVASSISRFINDNILLTSNASLSVENGIVTAIEKNEIELPEAYDINGLQVKNSYILSFSGALDSVLNHFQSISNFDDLKQALKTDYSQSRFFTQFLKIGLIVILSTLLINFFVFNHYFNAVNALQQTSQVNQATKQKLLKLDKEVSKSQKMVDDMLKSSSSKSSFYVNAIVHRLPQSILLTELNYQPLEKNIKKGKAIVLKDDTIIVSGESNNSESFSKWIADLETIDWIQNVEILSYEDTSKVISNFSVKLNLSHD
ncbi:hypothetical protein [Flavivirga eckloniae]|uniref:General secretion pathway protein n=1 Tax=Flavivirga eckloniae TaxID=1803846 RepID=A0A2K9PRH2_9FLAO|nr:hypothetical protein [Flavivirga eckloniae]AUP79673.1 hypothetical protein C1H87_13535 [Flavivirga eckloniae]